MTAAPQSQDNRELIIAIIRRFSELPELKNLPNAERNYLAGDIYNLLVAHDATIRNATLDELRMYIDTLCWTERGTFKLYISSLRVIDKINSLRSTPTTPKEQQR